jgi:glycerophosphoryl diester phosphodiesterase
MSYTLYAHRGNLFGPKPELENTPDYIDQAIKFGFNVEVDVWLKDDGNLYLGHDKPDYLIDYQWLLDRNKYLWVHCKSFHTINKLIHDNVDINYFWHQGDEYTLTSKGYLWTFPGFKLGKKSIAVLPESHLSKDNWDDETLRESYAVCTDYPNLYLEKFI